MDNQQAERLRALWKSGRDKYASFFTVLNEVRQQIGDHNMPEYCIKELQIGPSAIDNITGILSRADAAIARAELAAAKKVEQDRIRQKRERENERKRQLAEALVARNFTKVPRAREIVRPMVEKNEIINSKKLQRKYKDISHATFETAIAVEYYMLIDRLKKKEE